MRDKHPAWGARKIAHCLKRGGQTVPVPSTVHQILCRNERIKPSEKAAPSPSGHRFEKDAPNQLWQMDFKGHMPLSDGSKSSCRAHQGRPQRSMVPSVGARTMLKT
jgi:hypothetical protein